MNDSPTLNILAWRGYDHKDVIKMLEDQFELEQGIEIKINIDEYIGGAELFTIITQDTFNPKSYDILIVDFESLTRLKRKGRLLSINDSRIDLSFLKTDIQPAIPIQMGYLYGLPLRYAYGGALISKHWWTQHLKKKPLEQMQYAEIINNKSKRCSCCVEHHIGIWDPGNFFLPTMSIIGLIIDKYTPFITNNDKLKKMDAKMREYHFDNPDVAILIRDEIELKKVLIKNMVDVIICCGDFLLLSVIDMVKDQWVISLPKNEGAILFYESMVIPANCQDVNLAQMLIECICNKKFLKSFIKKVNDISEYKMNSVISDDPYILRRPSGNILLRNVPFDQYLQIAWNEWEKRWKEVTHDLKTVTDN